MYPYVLKLHAKDVLMVIFTGMAGHLWDYFRFRLVATEESAEGKLNDYFYMAFAEYNLILLTYVFRQVLDMIFIHK
jgi:hypothetical protein